MKRADLTLHFFIVIIWAFGFAAAIFYTIFFLACLKSL